MVALLELKDDRSRVRPVPDLSGAIADMDAKLSGRLVPVCRDSLTISESAPEPKPANDFSVLFKILTATEIKCSLYIQSMGKD